MKFGYRIIFIVSVVIFFLNCAYYYPFFSDDSLISLRYTQRFIEGKGLNWNDGHPVEGYSNLFWILCTAILGKSGLDLIWAARILGLACSVGTIAVILNCFRKLHVKKEYVFFATLLFVTTPCISVWAIGGLEQPLYGFLLTLVLTEVLYIITSKSFRRIYLLSVWLGLLALTRPDGFLFTIITAGFLLFTYRQTKTNLLTITLAVVCIPTLFLLSQLAFRYTYYGELVPNTALVKVKITFHHILHGAFYTLSSFLGTFVLSFLGLYSLFILVIRKKDLFGFYLLLNIAAWISYITLVGGDIFPAYRHYYVVLIFFIFSIILGLKLNLPNWVHNKLQAGIAILIVINVFLQYNIPQNHRAVEERWEFKGMNLGSTLKNTFPDKTLIAVTAAGCIPYASELPTVDMMGLNDYYIPRHPPANFGTGILAHELGDADYVMTRNPDIVIFDVGNTPSFYIGEQLKKNKTFTKNFIKVTASDRDADYILFFNTYGNSTGIKRTDSELTIPGYLFRNNEDNAVLFTKKKLLKKMSINNRYEIILNDIPSKNWKIKNVLGKNLEVDTEIYQKNGQLTIIMIPKKELLLESLVLEGKD
ncbi:hypothetical protein CLU96_2787 [Chryseobacterium sp. 52]|uniref:hypothetical protein n=1 Tax=Chryseobacterium sp. 52 TaxID=2035213 RepID=UPI000C17ECA4|nr:hypothetical protein [Chryseobacterium sp. 52]PIF45774.1 hypothetical protein CLU96_2787 [Chryseobacterium sp. 52]